MRTFVAIPVKVNDKIEEFMKAIEENFKAKLVEKENLHFTLKFLDERSEDEIKEIIGILEKIDFKKFKILLQGTGAFPNTKRARVIWIGAKSEELNNLGKTVSERLKKFNDEEFSPHLTIARLKIPDNVESILKNFSNTIFGEITVDSFILYKSTLTSKGPIYEIIQEFKAK